MAVYTDVAVEDLEAFLADYDIGNLLSYKGIAEGVENFEQVMHLRNLGVRSAQGYVFAPPLPGSSFLQLVEAMDTLGAEGGAYPAFSDKVAAA